MNQNLDCAIQVVDIEIQSLLALKKVIGDNFNLAVNLILSCQGRLIITGMGKSGLVGRKIAATMASYWHSSFLCPSWRGWPW